jgi:hypothetical protein
MTTINPDSTEEFEYIQTPAAPEQTKPDFDSGVPTTLVSPQLELLMRGYFNFGAN